MRVKGGSRAIKRHKKILKAAEGYRLSRSRLHKTATDAVLHAGQYAFAGRRKKKGDMRTLWIQRIKAALTIIDVKYSRFVKALKDKKIELDRKVLAYLAVNDKEAFDTVVKEAVR